MFRYVARRWHRYLSDVCNRDMESCLRMLKAGDDVDMANLVMGVAAIRMTLLTRYSHRPIAIAGTLGPAESDYACAMCKKELRLTVSILQKQERYDQAAAAMILVHTYRGYFYLECLYNAKLIWYELARGMRQIESDGKDRYGRQYAPLGFDIDDESWSTFFHMPFDMQWADVRTQI